MTAANRTAAANGSGGALITVAIVGIAAYMAAYYASDSFRRDVLLNLLVPDSLVTEWVGGDWSRFGLLHHLAVFAGAMVIGAVGGLTGWLVLHALRIDVLLDRCEQVVLSIATGLNLWSLFTLIVGLCGQLQNRWLFGAVAVAVVIVSLLRMSALQRARNLAPVPQLSNMDEDNRSLTRFGKWGLVLCVPAGLMILIGGMLPATYFDVREYHLQVPKEWYQQGCITFLPHNVYGNMPLGAEMHAILGMLLCHGKDDWWWGALIGKTVIAGFGPLAAAGVFLIGRRFVSGDAGAWGAFAYISTPWVAHVSMTGLIDGVVGGYLVLSVAVALIGMSLESNSRWRMIALAGFLAGSSIACKYPALVFLGIPLGLLVSFGEKWHIDWKSGTAFAIAAVLACGLWFGKNWVTSGNPTYPLLYGVFGGKSWNAEKDARWTKAHGPPLDASNRRFTPRQAFESLMLLAIKSDHHSPWLIPLALSAFCVWPAGKHRRLLAILYGLVGCSVLTWWLLTHRIDRFMVPMIPLLAVAAGLGATWSSDRGWRRAMVVLGCWCCVSSFLYISSFSRVADNRVFVSLTDLRTDIPRDPEQRHTRLNAGHRWLNENAPAGKRVLLVAEAQVFDFEMPILYNTCFDDCVLETLLRDRTREERRQVLQEQRISHIFVSWHELQRYREPGNYGYSDFPSWELFHTELVAQQGLLRPVALPINPEALEIFEVVTEGEGEEMR